ncbi:MAG: MFS transporter [Dehalococcoidia bacterium]|nr:MFS transporter [Dehalococcoidia bacterium]
MPRPDAQQPPDATAPSGGAFGAFRHRDFRLFWSGLVISHLGSWMQQVAQAWLLFSMTGSAAMVGLDGLFKTVPFVLVSLYAGTVVDRVDRRKTLIWVEALNGVLPLIMGTLVVTGRLEVWHFYLNSVLSASLGAFEAPSRQALLPNLVPRSDLMTAISLNSNVRKGSQMIGPAIGGILVAWFGAGWTFLISAAGTSVLVGSLLLMRTSNAPSTAPARNAVTALTEGFRYVRSEPLLLGLLVMQAAASLFGQYISMLVVFANLVHHVGPEGLGMLQSAAGLGALGGSLFLASRGDIRRKGRLLLGCGAVYAVAIMAFSWAPTFLMGLVFLVVVGAADVMMGTAKQTMIQLSVRHDMVGRVMALSSMSMRGVGPLGSFQTGLLTEFIGVQAAVAMGGVLTLTVMTAAFFLLPQLRSYGGGSGPSHDGEGQPLPAARPRRAEAD